MQKFMTLFLALLFFSTETMAMAVGLRVREISDLKELDEIEETYNVLGEDDSPDHDGITNCRENDDNQQDNSNLEQLAELSGTTNERPINFCNKNQLYGGEQLSKREKKKLKRKMRRQCKKKARAYKRAVARELLGNFQLGQFVQAAFKSKNKIIRNSGVNRTVSQELLTNIEPSQVANMNKEEFSAYMMNRIREQVPNLDALMAQSGNPQSAFTSGNFDQSESFPMNVVVSTARGNKCVVQGNEFPEEENFEPEECELCENVNIQDSFHNDCSYMVGAGLNENEARELVGAPAEKSQAGSDGYCNQDPDRDGSGVRRLNDTADKLCDIAESGMTPNFEIEASRNLYNDYTPELAAKRGDFTRKYLFDRLQKKCSNIEDAPDWLTDSEKFKDVVSVTHPEYLRPNNTPGDYGPDPNATPENQEQEAQYLQATLEKELSDLDNEIRELNEKKSQIESEIADFDRKLNGGNGQKGLRQMYNDINQDLQRPDLRLIEDQNVVMSQYIHEAEMAVAQKKKLRQDLHDTETRIASLNTEKSKPKFQSNPNGFLMVQSLREYYSQRDQIGPNNREFRNLWDENLFNQFKMARITGSVERVNEFGVPEDLMTPELQVAMRSLVKIQSYTCELAPIETKKVTLEGVLKFPLKVITAATLPVVGAIGLGATVAASPITTGISLFCQGCREPGQTPPILQWGNLFHLDLSKRGRRQAWKATKGFVSGYVNWGGALKVDKDHLITKHALEEYSRQKGGKKYSEMDQEEQDNFIDLVIADIQAANEASRQPAQDCEDADLTRANENQDGDSDQINDNREGNQNNREQDATPN